MITTENFLCGCDPKTKGRYSGDTVKSPIPGADPSYSDKRFDAQGFEVCPEHGERLYGWKSPLMATPSGRDALDYRKLGRDGDVKIITDNPEFPDRRDNRDPVLAYAELKAERGISKSGTNGHA